jgi:hypothetical protein
MPLLKGRYGSRTAGLLSFEDRFADGGENRRTVEGPRLGLIPPMNTSVSLLFPAL